MPKLSNILKREFEVAFSKNAQPVWLRILKYVVLATLIYSFWSSTLFPVILAVMVLLSLAVHFWYRFKTKGWTKSYGGWDYEKNRSRLES